MYIYSTSLYAIFPWSCLGFRVFLVVCVVLLLLSRMLFVYIHMYLLTSLSVEYGVYNIPAVMFNGV